MRRLSLVAFMPTRLHTIAFGLVSFAGAVHGGQVLVSTESQAAASPLRRLGDTLMLLSSSPQAFHKPDPIRRGRVPSPQKMSRRSVFSAVAAPLLLGPLTALRANAASVFSYYRYDPFDVSRPFLAEIPLMPWQYPKVEMLARDPVCQGRIMDQDFIAMRYVGRHADGTVFDNRYEKRPVIYEIGSFYLPGVDEILEDKCAGDVIRLTWEKTPKLKKGDEEDQLLLPEGRGPITVDLEVATIKHGHFGLKQRVGGIDAGSSRFWFADGELSLTSPPDYDRGHAKFSKRPIPRAESPYNVPDGVFNIWSSADGEMTPLWETFGEERKPWQGAELAPGWPLKVNPVLKEPWKPNNYKDWYAPPYNSAQVFTPKGPSNEPQFAN